MDGNIGTSKNDKLQNMESATENTFSNKITYYVKEYESYSFRRLHIMAQLFLVITIIGFFIWWEYSSRKRSAIRKIVKRMVNRVKDSTYACNLLKEKLGDDTWKMRIYNVIGLPITWGPPSYIG